MSIELECISLARRWAFNQAGEPVYGTDAISEPDPLTGDERVRLLAHVLGCCDADSKLAASMGRARSLDQHAVTVSGDLEIDIVSARTLIVASGYKS